MANNIQMSEVRFLLNIKGGEEILKQNQKLQSLEQDTIEKIRSQAEAGFMQAFGFAGKFDISFFMTDRISFQIHGADARTKATLAKNPKWLEQFANSVTIS